MLYLCKFVIFRIKLRGNLLACRSLSPWHASLPTSEGIKQFSADLVGK